MHMLSLTSTNRNAAELGTRPQLLTPDPGKFLPLWRAALSTSLLNLMAIMTPNQSLSRSIPISWNLAIILLTFTPLVVKPMTPVTQEVVLISRASWQVMMTRILISRPHYTKRTTSTNTTRSISDISRRARDLSSLQSPFAHWLVKTSTH